MLAIRLQRVGRKGHAMYRLAVQESQRHPSSGRVVAYVGSYDPHTKDCKVQVELAQKYLDNGAQPSPRVVKLLSDAGVKLPKWVVKSSGDKSKAIRNSDKLRKNQLDVPVDKVEEVKEVKETTDEPTDEAEVVSETAEVTEEPEVKETTESATAE